MRQGKLTNTQLQKTILEKLPVNNSETIVGAGIGEDCCAIDTGDLCVVSTDPITASDHQAGTLAIHINANDIASAGAMPIAALVTILIPPSAEQRDVDEVVQHLTDTARSMNIDITGGHTEVTDSVNKIVVSVTMIGKPVVKGRIIKTANVQPDDWLIMTKYAGLEGTAIIAQDYARELTALLDEEDQAMIRDIQQQLSVVPEGTLVAPIEGIHAMHDVTEGGVLSAVNEMCEASGVGAEIDLEKIPVLSVTQKICDFYGIDVYSLISSGSLLISAENADVVMQALNRAGIEASVIGRAIATRGCYNQLHKEIVPVAVDELYKVIEKQR